MTITDTVLRRRVLGHFVWWVGRWLPNNTGWSGQSAFTQGLPAQRGFWRWNDLYSPLWALKSIFIRGNSTYGVGRSAFLTGRVSKETWVQNDSEIGCPLEWHVPSLQNRIVREQPQGRKRLCRNRYLLQFPELCPWYGIIFCVIQTLITREKTRASTENLHEPWQLNQFGVEEMTQERICHINIWVWMPSTHVKAEPAGWGWSSMISTCLSYRCPRFNA